MGAVGEKIDIIQINNTKDRANTYKKCDSNWAMMTGLNQLDNV